LLQDQALFDGQLVKNVREVVGVSGSTLLEERDQMGLGYGRVSACGRDASTPTDRHIHLRDGIVLEILIIIIIENFVIIKGHSFRPQHFREHLELFGAETLVLPLLFGPAILLA
jgi:hypothetical protein